MLYRDPHPVILSRADVVVLIDPDVPSWSEIVVNILDVGRLCSRDFMVIQIPVDSGDRELIREWRHRIATARA